MEQRINSGVKIHVLQIIEGGYDYRIFLRILLAAARRFGCPDWQATEPMKHVLKMAVGRCWRAPRFVCLVLYITINKLGWLPFYDEAKVNKCSLVLKRLQGNCHSYMYDLLKCNTDLHTRSGRYSALNLVCPRYNRESEGGRTFSVSATRLWNSLPIDLKKGTCVTSFRKAIYSHFLTRYNDVDHFSLSET